MKRIEFEFNGRYYFLAMTAEALFTVYDQFGYTTDILATTGCLEPTVDGYKNLCWMAALLASQGELQRRRMGYSAQEMLSADDLRTNLPPTKVAELQDAVVEAMQEGFRRETEPEEEQEINLVLRERDEAEKKSRIYGTQWISCCSSLSLPLRTLRRPPPHPRPVGRHPATPNPRSTGGRQWQYVR